MNRLVSIVMPVYNEGDAVLPYLRQITDEVSEHSEVLVVHDMPEDSTVPSVTGFAGDHPHVRPVLNELGPGPANAIRAGIAQSVGDVVVVTMSDGSDEAHLIDEMARLVRSGNAVVAASRYMPGGSQSGGPFLKRTMSRTAGLTLHHLARVGTRDATNSFKAYSGSFLRSVEIESDGGFEIGIELVAKAHRAGLPIAEVPTHWTDRTDGESRFRVAAWTPKYLKWYAYAFGIGRRSRATSEEART